VWKHDHTSKEIWPPELLYFAGTEDERLDTFAEEAPKLEVHSQIVIKSVILKVSSRCYRLLMRAKQIQIKETMLHL